MIAFMDQYPLVTLLLVIVICITVFSIVDRICTFLRPGIRSPIPRHFDGRNGNGHQPTMHRGGINDLPTTKKKPNPLPKKP